MTERSENPIKKEPEDDDRGQPPHHGEEDLIPHFWQDGEEAAPTLDRDRSRRYETVADFAADLSAESVHTRRIAVKLAEKRLHLFRYFLGHLRGSVVVKVYCIHSYSL